MDNLADLLNRLGNTELLRGQVGRLELYSAMELRLARTERDLRFAKPTEAHQTVKGPLLVTYHGMRSPNCGVYTFQTASSLSEIDSAPFNLTLDIYGPWSKFELYGGENAAVAEASIFANSANCQVAIIEQKGYKISD